LLQKPNAPCKREAVADFVGISVAGIEIDDDFVEILF
jgi:hypothetical protein